MSRKRLPPRSNTIHLRLREEVSETEAASGRRSQSVHHCRLLRSFKAAVRSLEMVPSDMEICWARFDARFLRMGLADELANALNEGNNGIKTLAQLIIKHRADDGAARSTWATDIVEQRGGAG